MPARPMSEESRLLALQRVRQRRRIVDGGGRYFGADSTLKFVPTGSTVLDCTLGGGWPLGRVVNIVGDQSSGKTLLAIEGMTNFALMYPKGKIRVRDAEAAFLPQYAEALGLPLDRVEITRGKGESDTVEDFYEDLSTFQKKLKEGEPGMYVLDSLDAISDEAEVGREFGQDSYGTGKAKQMSQMFRRITGKIESSKICLIIISQTRDRIAVGFGRKYTRSGGRALDFYSSLVVYLAHKGEISRTVRGIKRAVGVDIKAKATKNKVGLPLRSCEFPIIFNYGVEDVTAGLDWLDEHKLLEEVGLTANAYKDLRKKALYIKLDQSEHEEWRARVSKAVKKGWRQVEASFQPSRGKYR